MTKHPSQKAMRAEIEKNQHALKEQLVELYAKLKSGDLTEAERNRLSEAINKIKHDLEPKTRTMCKHFGIPTDSEVMRIGRGL